MKNNEILEKMKKDGYCVVNKFNNEEVSIIRSELNEIYLTMPDYSSLYSKTNLE